MSFVFFSSHMLSVEQDQKFGAQGHLTRKGSKIAQNT